MSAPIPSIGLIVCSQRKPRAGPQIADLVLHTLEGSNEASAVKIKVIDLATWNLPMFDEPGVPSQIMSTTDYKYKHTQEWSYEILSHSAFIFVTPQYNWGYPASVKNAIDYLFNEWKGKPAMIVSYGGHGGEKAAGQLKQVLHGVRMQVAETMPSFTFPDRRIMAKASRGEDLQLLGEDGIWNDKKEDIRKAFGELKALLELDQSIMQN